MYVGRDHGVFTGMIGDTARIPIMTLLKLLATAMVALTFMLLAMPSFAANSNDGVNSGSANQPDPAAKQRRHRKHKHHRQHRQQRQDRNPSGPGPAGNELG
jgi:hypothetical protein